MVTPPARGANRIVFWFLSTVTVVVLMFGYHTSTSGPTASGRASAIAPVTPGTPVTPVMPGTPVTPAAPAPSGATTPSSGTGGGSGSTTQAPTTTVTGEQEQTQWGPVQVELTISDGKVTDVAVPVYPNGNGRDAEINSYALPQLVQETISAQSAQIDMVSGATVTSDGYVRSLQSALDKAGL